MTLRIRNSLSVVALSLVLSTAVCAQVVVQTKEGKLEGVAGQATVVFKGIPFAKAPVGDFRWKAPQPAEAWNGVRKADSFSPGCIQHKDVERLPWSHEYMLQGATSEDCLYLNIWTPADFKSRKLPVYVFFHGGGFTEGAGSVEVYDGANLAKRGIVMVTVNYRLGVLGFLAHPGLSAESPQHVSGNYGFLDGVASLQWVKDNIAAFGGDPAKVTIGGQSAGSAMVHDLMVSPLAKGLFRAGVAESGTSLVSIPMKSLKEAEDTGVEFAKSQNANSIEELRRVAPDYLLPGVGAQRGIRFGPIADGWAIPDAPLKLHEDGKANDVPLLTGMQADERSGMLQKAYGHVTADEWHKQVQQQYGDMAAKFNELYPSADDAAAGAAQIASARERGEASMYLWASRVAPKQNGKIYTYYFNQPIPWPDHPDYKAFHTGEMVYILSNLDKLPRPFTDVDKKVAATMSGYLVNFVTNGDPNGTGLPRWEVCAPQPPQTLEISSNTKMRPLMDPAKLKFWYTYFDSPQSRTGMPL